MIKGDIYRFNKVDEKDKYTGKIVTRLTDNSGSTIHPYFTQPLFSADGRYLLVSSDRTGSWQLYSLEIKTATMIQLTNEPDISPHSSCLDGVRMIAYYWSGNTLKSVRLDNLVQEELFRVPNGFRPSILSITSDGEALDFSYSEVLELSTVTGQLYSGMGETLFRRPSSVVMRFNIMDRKAKAIWGEREWISHVITSPTDKNIVVFNHEGQWHLVQRTWVVKEDTYEVYPLIVQKRHFERAGHEFFTSSGRLVTQHGRRDTPNGEWICSDVFMNPDGTDIQRYEYPANKPMHVQVNHEETMGVGDGLFVDRNAKDGNKFMSLIKYENGKAKQEMLCAHDTSWKTQHSHPHPIFTPDDNYVIFDSDREGYTNIYLVEVSQ